MSKRQTPARTAKLAEPEKLEDKVVENVVPEPVAQPAAEPETPEPVEQPAAAPETAEPFVVLDGQTFTTEAAIEGATIQGNLEEPARSGDGLVEVRNDLGTYLQQPSTGIRIHAHSTARVADDSWLGMQVRARLLTRV